MMEVISLLKFWCLQRVIGLTPPGDDPWMDKEGADRFRQELSLAKSYVEFGSGGSTILADRRGIPVITVESDRFYARAVASRLAEGTKVVQAPVHLGLTKPLGVPVFHSIEKASKYVSAPFGEDWFPDFILVDGRYRSACALESARQANIRGTKAVLMIDDYTTRSHYHIIEQSLGSPEIVGRAAIFHIGEQKVPQQAVASVLWDKR